MKTDYTENIEEANLPEENDSLAAVIKISAKISNMLEEIDLEGKELMLTKEHIQNNLSVLVKHALLCNSKLNGFLSNSRKLNQLVEELKLLREPAKIDIAEKEKLLEGNTKERAHVNNPGGIVWIGSPH